MSISETEKQYILKEHDKFRKGLKAHTDALEHYVLTVTEEDSYVYLPPYNIGDEVYRLVHERVIGKPGEELQAKKNYPFVVRTIKKLCRKLGI